MKKLVLITGGAGFIGSNLALKLLTKGYRVRILDNLSPQIHGPNPEETSLLYGTIKGKCEFILGSVNNDKDIVTAMSGVNYVIHLAAETGTGQSMYQIARYVEINSLGTAKLLDYIVNHKNEVEKFIIASSRSIYGEGKYYSDDLGKFVFPLSRSSQQLKAGDFDVKYKEVNSPLSLCATDEDSAINTESLYAVTKFNQEQMALTVCKSIGIPCVAFRYQNVYGPGQSLINPYTGILAIFSSLINSGSTIRIFEDGLESRDFVYIDDVTDATIAGMEANIFNDVFNVGYGEPISVIRVARTLMDCYNRNTEMITTGEFRLGDIRHNYADITKIKKVLGFTPVINFETGIRKFANWVKLQNLASSSAESYERSLEELREKGLMK
jgi:dTDP-L-rhamnose 4-epimerase